MNRLNLNRGQFTLVLRVICAAAVLAVLALLSPFDWRARFVRRHAAGGLRGGR